MFSFRLDFTVITFKISCWQRKIWLSQKHLKRHNPRSWQIRRSSTKSEFLLERFDKQNKPFFQSQVSGLGLRCFFSLWPKHYPSECWCKTAQCHRCQEKGLIANMCTQNRESHSTRHVEIVSLTDVTEGTVDLSLYILKGKGKGRFGYQVELLLEGKKVSMEVDTGSVVPIVAEREYNNLLNIFSWGQHAFIWKPTLVSSCRCCEVSDSRTDTVSCCYSRWEACATRSELTSKINLCWIGRLFSSGNILKFTWQPGGPSDMVWCYSGLKI